MKRAPLKAHYLHSQSESLQKTHHALPVDLGGVACADRPAQAAQMEHSGARTIEVPECDSLAVGRGILIWNCTFVQSASGAIVSPTQLRSTQESARTVAAVQALQPAGKPSNSAQATGLGSAQGPVGPMASRPSAGTVRCSHGVMTAPEEVSPHRGMTARWRLCQARISPACVGKEGRPAGVADPLAQPLILVQQCSPLTP